MGVMPIPCLHFKITIVKRSQGQSAVAGAAYQSGERLFSEYDQRTKFYNKKKELVHAEIMLPSHAPPGYADRATLWNAVEAVENQGNSQLARRIVLAFPVEVPKEQYLSMIKEFCQEQFVSKGMIADFAIHDKGDGNPHAHILLTLRAMDEHGKWLPKARKVYDLAEDGILCVLVKMPCNLAVLDRNAADSIPERFSEVTDWYIGGHSLGGAMAASYAAKHTDELDGLVLLAAYSTADLTDSGLRVYAAYGSEDGVLNCEKYEADRINLPQDTTETVIDGGCHAGFGSYGAQKGDGAPVISAEEQQQQTADALAAWMNLQ